MLQLLTKIIIIYPFIFIYGLVRSFFIQKKKMDEPIDFVVTWVDGNDRQWQAEKNKYLSDNKKEQYDNNEERYREWDLFKYWFRAVETYAPWVNKVYFVTWGHIPAWLNTDCEKLVIVKHSDYMDKAFLPTFSSISIEMNLHKIKGLNEHFVYFNDDVFINTPLKPEDFFQAGLPLACSMAKPVIPVKDNTVFRHQIFSVAGLMNGNEWAEAIKRNPHKWFYWRYGLGLLQNLAVLQKGYLLGMDFTHLCQAFRKSTMKKVWEKYPTEMNTACLNKFRQATDPNHQIFTIQEIVDGNYIPMTKQSLGRHFWQISTQFKEIASTLHDDKVKIICINDDRDINADNFEHYQSELHKIFEEKLPHKSNFEK